MLLSGEPEDPSAPPAPPPPIAREEVCSPPCAPGRMCIDGRCEVRCDPKCMPDEPCDEKGECASTRQTDEGRGRALPDGYHHEKRARRGLVVAGAIPFAVGYIGSIGVGIYCAASSPPTGFGPPNGECYRGAGNVLFVFPVIGPILRLLIANGSGQPGFIPNNGVDLWVSVFAALWETVGFVLVPIGIANGVDVMVPNGNAARGTSTGLRWAVAPWVASGAPGLSLSLQY
jgi:hypothetical protein